MVRYTHNERGGFKSRELNQFIEPPQDDCEAPSLCHEIMENIFNRLDLVTAVSWSLADKATFKHYKKDAPGIFGSMPGITLRRPNNHPSINTFVTIQHGSPLGLASVLQTWMPAPLTYDSHKQRFNTPAGIAKSLQAIVNDKEERDDEEEQALERFQAAKEARQENREERRAHQRQRGRDRQEPRNQAEEEGEDPDDVSHDSPDVSSEDSGLEFALKRNADDSDDSDEYSD
jgi:hypothetical protein